jgi:peroxiredoxin
MREVGLLLLVGLLSSAAAADDKIKLTDGTEFSATLLGRDGGRLVLQVPRAQVATLNGEPLPPPVTTGYPAPDFEAVDVAGTAHALSKYRGQPVLLQFWATWCPHCRSDLSMMKDLAARYDEKHLKILTVSIDQEVEQLRTFVKNEQLPYTVISVSEPTAPSQQATLAEAYEMQGVPAYYLIGADGLIVKTFSGAVTEGGGARKGELERALQTLVDAVDTAS